MICPNCGRESNTRFCTFCGAPMQAPSAPAGEAPQPPQGPQQQWTPPQGGQQQGPQYQGQPQGPQYQGQSQGTQPQEVQSGPVQWQQAVRYDANSTYQYHQTYDAENQPGGDQKGNEKTAKKDGKKGGKKPLLFILLGVGATILIAAGLLIFFGIRNGWFERKESKLVIVTNDGGIYLNDEKGMLVERSDGYMLSNDLDCAIICRNDQWYFVKGGEMTRFGRAGIMLDGRAEDLSWILYHDSDNNVYLYRPGADEEIQIVSKATVSRCLTSRNKQYLYIAAQDGKSFLIYKVDFTAGKITPIHQGKTTVELQFVDDAGYLYYLTMNSEWHITDGEDQTLEGVRNVALLKSKLLLGEYDKKQKTMEWYIQDWGAEGERVALSDMIDEEIAKHIDSHGSARFFQATYNGLGSYGNSSCSSATEDEVIVEVDGDLYFVDLVKGTSEPFMKGVICKELKYLFLEKNKKTVYVLIEGDFYRLTRGKENWSKERIARNCDWYTVYEKGILYGKHDSVYLWNGKDSQKIGEFNGSDYAVSDDLKSAAFVDGKEIYYIDAPGAEPEAIDRIGDHTYMALFKGYIYYVDRHNDLLRVKPGRDPEVVLEDVDYVYKPVY